MEELRIKSRASLFDTPLEKVSAIYSFKDGQTMIVKQQHNKLVFYIGKLRE